MTCNKSFFSNISPYSLSFVSMLQISTQFLSGVRLARFVRSAGVQLLHARHHRVRSIAGVRSDSRVWAATGRSAARVLRTPTGSQRGWHAYRQAIFPIHSYLVRYFWKIFSRLFCPYFSPIRWYILYIRFFGTFCPNGHFFQSNRCCPRIESAQCSFHLLIFYLRLLC